MKKRIIAICLAVLALVTFLIVPVSAVASETVKSETSKRSFYEKYPWFNMLPLTYSDVVGTYSGITVNVDSDGVIDIKGTVNEPSAGNKNYYDIVLFDSFFVGSVVYLPSGNVTFSTNIAEDRAYILLKFSDGTKENVYTTNTFLGMNRTISKVVLRLRYDDNADDMTIMPMLNTGDVAYPFQPFSKRVEMVDELYDMSYSEGYAQGHWEGLNKGYENGLRDGENTYYAKGVEYGYANGYEFGYNEGYYEGNWQGLNAGYENGKQEGYEMGHAQGYTDGFSVGTDYGEQQEVSENLIGVVDAIATAPATAIGTMLDFELFGVNLASLVFKLFTIIIILLIIGIFIKFVT